MSTGSTRWQRCGRARRTPLAERRQAGVRGMRGSNVHANGKPPPVTARRMRGAHAARTRKLRAQRRAAVQQQPTANGYAASGRQSSVYIRYYSGRRQARTSQAREAVANVKCVARANA